MNDEQQDLFAPYQKHSATSEGAADIIKPRTPTLRERVYRCIKEAGSYGLTDAEVQDRLEMDGSTQRPRRVKLVELGLVRDSGRTRLTRSGRKAVVWEAVP